MLSARPPRPGRTLPITRASTGFDRSLARRLWQLLRVVLAAALAPIHLVLYTLAGLLWQVQLPAEAAATVLVVVINLLINGTQLALTEYRLAQLRRAFRAPVQVWRTDTLHACAPESLVPGDIVQLQRGDRVPCPATVMQGTALALDVSALTGERAQLLPADGAAIPAGADVVGGAAWIVCDAVAAAAPDDRAPLTRETPQLRMVWRVVVAAALLATAVAVLTLGVATARGTAWPELVRQLTVVAGLIPNALVLFVTVTQATAALASARAGVLVQRASAVELWAGVDVVCFDKTGTLTTNNLRVSALVPLALTEAACADVLGAYVACDGAGNQTSQTIAAAFPRAPLWAIASTGFDSARKWSAVVTADAAYYLGAPDVLMASVPEAWHASIAAAGAGSTARGLLLIRALLPQREDTLPMTADPLGMVLLADTIRPGASALVHQLQHAGVRCVVVSGDDPHTAAGIAALVGLQPETVRHGATLAGARPAELRAADVIGRVLPDQKAAVVRAWQATGARVAFVGDGVNDIPALLAADVGVAFAAAHAAVRDAAGLVVTNPDAAVLLQLRRRGETLRARVQRITTLVVTRVVAAAVVWVGMIVLALPTWQPLESTAIALFGVGMPSIIIAVIPHRTLTGAMRWRWIIGRALAAGIVLTGGWWWAARHGVSDTRALTAFSILMLWTLVAGMFLRDRFSKDTVVH